MDPPPDRPDPRVLDPGSMRMNATHAMIRQLNSRGAKGMPFRRKHFTEDPGDYLGHGRLTNQTSRSTKGAGGKAETVKLVWAIPSVSRNRKRCEKRQSLR